METAQGKDDFDLDALVDIVPTYKCRFCSFSTETPATMKSHLMEHLGNTKEEKKTSADDIEMPINEGSVGVKTKEEAIVSENVQSSVAQENDTSSIQLNDDLKVNFVQNDEATISSECSLPIVSEETKMLAVDINQTQTNEYSTAASTQRAVVNEELGALDAPTLMATKELFLCGQCHTGFHSMEECKTHIEQDHQMVVSSEDLGDTACLQDGGKPINDALTQEEAMLLWQKHKKKPGRKRKCEELPREDIFDQELAEGLLEDDDYRVSLESTRGAGKRKVKVPKALLDEYFVGVKKDGDDNQSESTTQNEIADPDDPDYDTKSRKLVSKERDGASAATPRKQPRIDESDDDQDATYLPSETEVDDAEAEGEGGHETDAAEDLAPSNKPTPPFDKIVKRKKRKLFKAVKQKRTHRRKRKFKCSLDFCKARFWSKDACQEHFQCHDTGKGTLVCYKCGEKFKMWPQCLLHMWRSHQIDLDLYRCDICDFRADLACKIDLHKAIHSDVRAYICKVCKRGFKQPSQLINHEALHGEYDSTTSYELGKKTCIMCDKTFATEKGLKDHMHVVHGRPKFQCTLCSHISSSKAALESHIRIHTGDKPFHCDFCGFQCADHNTLRRHRMRHTGTKPYACPHCSYTCIQSISLKSHIKTKHGGLGIEGLWSCKLCVFNTVSEKRFKTHMYNHESGAVQRSRTKGKTTEIITRGGVSLGKVVISKPQTTKPKSTLVGASLSCTECGHSTSSLAEMLSHLAQHSASSRSGNPKIVTTGATDVTGTVSSVDVVSGDPTKTSLSSEPSVVLPGASASQEINVLPNHSGENIQPLEETILTDHVVTETVPESVIAIPVSLRSDGGQGIILNQPPGLINTPMTNCIIVDRFGNVITQDKSLQNNGSLPSVTVLNDISEQNLVINPVLQPFTTDSNLGPHSENTIQVINIPHCSGVPPLHDIFEAEKSDENSSNIELKPQQSTSPTLIIDSQTMDNVDRRDGMLEVSVETGSLLDHIQSSEVSNAMEFIIQEPVEENVIVNFEEINQDSNSSEIDLKRGINSKECEISEEVILDNDMICSSTNNEHYSNGTHEILHISENSLQSSTIQLSENTQNSIDILSGNVNVDEIQGELDGSSQAFPPLFISKGGKLETVNLAHLADGGFLVTDLQGRPVQVNNMQIMTVQGHS